MRPEVGDEHVSEQLPKFGAGDLWRGICRGVGADADFN
jgi:hypothetical protein